MTFAVQLRARQKQQLQNLIYSFGGTRDSHKAAEVYSVLTPLSQLAQRTDITILGLMHLSKAMQGRSLYRLLGSIGFAACARSVMAIGQAPGDPKTQVLCHLKCNAAPMAESQRFSLDSGRFLWGGTTGLRPGDVLGPEMSSEDQEATSQAKDFLNDYLINGPRPAKEIYQAAEDAGIAKRTLDRAKAHLGVRSEKRDFTGQWSWQLSIATPKVATKDAKHISLATFDSNH